MTDRNSHDAWLPSRRAFLRQSAAGAALLAAGSAAAQAPARGGRLVIAATGGGATDSLDPRRIASIYHGNLGYAFANCLTEIGEGNKLVPELATSWEAADGGKRWIFNLRAGVTFHNGKTMTAADVVWSLNLHRGADSKSAAKPLLASVTDIKADGANRVVVELSAPSADMPFVMSDVHLLVIPAETTKFDDGVGTGPFRVKRFVPGQRLEGERNPGYWKSGRAHVADIELLAINDAVARLNALQTGEVQVIERVDSKTVALLERNKDVQVFRTGGGGHRPFLMHCDTAPYSNPDLRMALKLGIDREDFLKKIFRGFGRLANDHPIPETDPWFPGGIAQRKYDPDQARALYKKSGHSGPLALSTSEAAYAEAIDGAALFKEQMAKIGIEIAIQREPADGYWSNVWLKKPFMMGAWGGRPTADIMLSTAYKSDAPWNDTRWKNAEFDRLLAEARGELDAGKRKDLYRRGLTMINETGGAIIPCFIDFVDAARVNVKGWFPGNFGLSGMRAAERLWLAA
jgi:peptide/nickel transport system substrate-binding protein